VADDYGQPQFGGLNAEAIENPKGANCRGCFSDFGYRLPFNHGADHFILG
jgi:hypothetical protein